MSDAKEKTKAEPPYRPPVPELGEGVHYYMGGVTANPCAAMITQVDGNSVVCNIFMPNSYNCLVRDGVRHVSDPRTKDNEKIENGLWDFTPTHKAMWAILNALK